MKIGSRVRIQGPDAHNCGRDPIRRGDEPWPEGGYLVGREGAIIAANPAGHFTVAFTERLPDRIYGVYSATHPLYRRAVHAFRDQLTPI